MTTGAGEVKLVLHCSMSGGKGFAQAAACC